MSQVFLRKLLNREFDNLTVEEIELIVNNPEVFYLKKKDAKEVVKYVVKKTVEENKSAIAQVLESGLPTAFAIFNSLDQNSVSYGAITIDLREALINNLKKMDNLKLCVFIDKVLKFGKDNKIRFFRNKDYSLHEINGVISKAFGLSLVFEVFKVGKAKNFLAIDYNKIDKSEMINALNRQLVRYLYVLELIAEVVLNTEENKLFGTKINKSIREAIDDYVFLIQEERKNVARTGIGVKKTWTYTLCNSVSLEVEDNGEDNDE